MPITAMLLAVFSKIRLDAFAFHLLDFFVVNASSVVRTSKSLVGDIVVGVRTSVVVVVVVAESGKVLVVDEDVVGEDK